MTHRLARLDDLPALRALADRAIRELQRPFLDARQVEASQALMGIDTQLVVDGTYFVVEDGGALAGCGGWSRRATLYGGDASPGRDPALLDPAREPARIRAMYTHPDHTRKGVGRLILALCESAAWAEGFRRAEMMATLAGAPLYQSCGYAVIEPVTDGRGGAPVPLLRMGKTLASTEREPSGTGRSFSPPTMRIQVDDPTRPPIRALLAEHLRDMHAISPPGSVHALEPDGLAGPDVTFWSVWDGDTLLGCGALKALGLHHGEIKSMRTPSALRRRGAGRAVLDHIIAEARARGYGRLSLETGASDAFAPAHRLYESRGFTRCGPFGSYTDDPNSVFMTRTL